MLKRKQNRLSNNKNFEEKEKTNRLKDIFISLISFSKRIFHRFKPQEKYFVGIAGLIILSSIFAIGIQLYISKTKTVPAFGGEYREAIIGLPQFINPVLASTNDVDRDLVNLIYSSLMRYNSKGELVPDLAKAYTISEDGKEYRFILKEELRWEDGSKLTAEDVLFTLGLIQNPQYSSPLFQSWQGVEISIENSNEVVFRLTSPYPPFLENTTIGILPKHIWQDVSPKNFVLTNLNLLKPVGSGMYKLEKFAQDNSGLISSYTLQRNDAYYGQKPFIDKITFKFFESEEEAIRAYNSKTVDGISFISSTNIEKIKNPQNIILHEFEMPRYFAIFINQSKNNALKNQNIREALSLATNRKQIINGVLSGFAQFVGTPIPPNLSEYYNKDSEAIDYNPQKAIEILKDAGWEDRNGDGILENSPGEDEEPTQLSFTLVTADKTELLEVANLIKEQWGQIGVLLNIKAEPLGELQQGTIRLRNYELLMFGEILGTIPDPFSFWHSSQKIDPGLNLANYENNDVDTLLEEARQEINKESRIKKLKEFQKKVMEDTPAIFLYDPTYIYPVDKTIQGIQGAFIVDSSFRFADIQNWYITTKRTF